MDEIEFRQAYNKACTSAERIDTRETQEAVMRMLELVWDVHERLIEMQADEDDDE